MKNIKLAMGIATVLTMTSSAVMAGAWDLTQEVAGNLEQTQTDSDGSKQFGNDSLLGASGSINAGSTQTTAATKLIQTGTTTGSTQIANSARGGTINGLTQTNSASSATMTQKMSGNGNLQAMNRIKTAGEVVSGTQIILDSGNGSTFTMNQGTSSVSVGSNIQAGNLIQSDTVTFSDQDITAQNFSMNQFASGGALQAGNAVIYTDYAASTGVVNQTVTTAGTNGTLMNQTSTDATQAANYLGTR